MTTDVAIQEQPRPNLIAGGRPMAIVPTSMDEAWRLGKAICMAGMAPRGMESPEKCMIAIMRGMEVGLSPMQALDKIAVVNGRPTIWGDGAMALVRGSGVCDGVSERIDGTGDHRNAICEARRKGERDPTVRSFSVAQAKEAGLWGKAGPWKQFPDRMLQMRARAFALRDLFADVLGGLYLREELEDEGKVAGSVIEGPSAPPADVTHLPAPTQKPEVAAEEVEVVDEDDADKGEPFDPEAWLDDARGVFAGCKTLEDVDQAHGMFEETATNDLAQVERQKYEDIHQAALNRFEPSKAAEKPAAPVETPVEDDDDGTFPGDDAINALQEQKPTYVQEMRAKLKDPERTGPWLRAIWKDTTPDRKRMVEEGTMSAEIRSVLQAEFTAEIQRMEAPKQQDDGPSAPPADAPEDDAKAFDAEFRAKIAACETIPDVNAYSTSTLPDRNGKWAQHPLNKEWKQVVDRRRKQIAGIA
jgi:hypothetical protein